MNELSREDCWLTNDKLIKIQYSWLCVTLPGGFLSIIGWKLIQNCLFFFQIQRIVTHVSHTTAVPVVGETEWSGVRTAHAWLHCLTASIYRISSFSGYRITFEFEIRIWWKLTSIYSAFPACAPSDKAKYLHVQCVPVYVKTELFTISFCRRRNLFTERETFTWKLKPRITLI